MSMDVSFILILVRVQVQQLLSIIWDMRFPLMPSLLFTICVKTSRSVREVVGSRSLTAHDEAGFLTVATFKTIYERFFKRRSVTNTANFFHSSSDWGKHGTTERSRGGEEVDVREEDRDRKREQSTALIYVYWFTSLPPHWFQCLPHPFKFHFIRQADI